MQVQANSFDPVALAYVAHGNQAVEDKKWDKAFGLYHEAVKLDCRLADAWNNLGHIYQVHKKNPNAAAVCFGRACALIPNSPLFLANLGDVFWELKKYEASEAILEQCLNCDPTRGGAWYDLAMVYICTGRLDQAVWACQKAADYQPTSPLPIRAMTHAYLYAERWEEGFRCYQNHWQTIFDDVTKYPVPEWDGTQNLAGKTLYVHCNQGIGDWIQFIRYIPLIEGVGKIIVDPPPEIVRMFAQHLDPKGKVIEWRPMMGGLQTTADYHCNLMCLPYALSIYDGSGVILPSGQPYLSAPPARWDIPWSKGVSKKVGIVWGGNPDLKVDNLRSASVEDFVSSLALPGVELYSLQFGERGRQLFSEELHPLVRDMSSLLTDFTDTAALMRQMDAVVSVDTSCAHLSAAMGIPTHVLVRTHNPDWRWGLYRDDCEWYDSVTVHRQERTDTWADVLARVANKLMET